SEDSSTCKVEDVVETVAIWRMSIVRQGIAHLLAVHEHPCLVGALFNPRSKVGNELPGEALVLRKAGVKRMRFRLKEKAAAVEGTPPSASFPKILLSDLVQVELELSCSLRDVP